MADKKERHRERIQEAEPYEGYWEDSYDYIFSKLEKFFKDQEFTRAIEFGCGQGKFFERYAEHFDDVIAIESNWSSRDNAMETAYWSDIKHIEFRSSEDDGEDLTEDSFDFVFVGQSFRHMTPEEADDTVQKSRKLLRKGGIMVIFAPHLKRGQDRFLKTYMTKEGGYKTEAVDEEEFQEANREEEPKLPVQRFKSSDFEGRDGFAVKDIVCFHDTILPGFIDSITSRDSLINFPPLKGIFGSELMVVLEKK